MSDVPNSKLESHGGAVGAVTWPPDLTEDHSLAGAKIGENYQLLERIGIGGMGVVYRAQQVYPVRRLVAIKLIKLGLDTPQIVARFESERQALALLEHSGISRVYDAGTTDTGRPYFVMEHVAGRPITEWCDGQRLNTAGRLELFRQACAAVQHAHYNGILHRDLKPSNILVAANADGAPQVKIIDFGIAKAIQKTAEPSPLVTVAGQFVGTPAYTSPEQARGDEVDTRADIYSLGVVLYELLSGALPFDLTKSASDRSDPPRPSARLRTINLTEATKLASLRSADKTSLRRQLRGDLDQIVLKSMHPDRAQRYDSAAGMSDDIRRYLAHEPILARPPTLAYEARKFARRNRVLVAAVGMVIAAVLIGGVAATIGLIRARQALAREALARKAEQQSNLVSKNITGFLCDMLTSVDPHRAQGEDIRVRDVLDQAGKELPTKLKAQPLVAASIHLIIGQTYSSMGADEAALAQVEASLALRQAELGPNHPDTLAAMHSQAVIINDLGREQDAEKILRELLTKRRAINGADDSATLQAEEMLALVLQHTNRAAEADPLHRHVVDTRRRTLGEDHPDTLHALHNMAPIVEALGRPDEAEAINRKVAETRTRVLGPDHPSTVLTWSNLGADMLRNKRYAEAEPILRDALARNERVNGKDHPDTLMSLNNLANAVQMAGHNEEAVAMLRELLTRMQRSMPENHPNAFIPIANLAQILEEMNRPDESLVYFKMLYDRAPKTQMPAKYVSQYMSQWGIKLVKFGHYTEAEAPLLEARKRLDESGLTHGPKMKDTLAALVTVYERTNRPNDAAQWRAELARVSDAAATMPASQPRR